MTLVEKVVLDRLRQKQLSQSIQQPELTNLVNIQGQIEDLLGNTKLSYEEKESMLQRAQNRFTFFKDKLPARATTGIDTLEVPPASSRATPGRVRSATVPAPSAAVPAPSADVPAPSADVPAPSAAVHGPALAVSAPIAPVPAPPLAAPAKTADVSAAAAAAAAPDMFGTIKIPDQYEKKFSKLKKFLSENPGMLGKNLKNEMVLNGRAIPKSNFDNLIRNLYLKSSKYNLTGLDSFAETLHRAHMPSSVFSNSEFSPILKAVPATAPSSPTMPGKRPVSTHKSRSRDRFQSADEGDSESQSGQGKPPGKRPRILKLYR